MNTDTNISRKEYIERYLKIKSKNADIVPFIFNKGQQRLYDVLKQLRAEGKPMWVIILKARQIGFSTEVSGLGFTDAATNLGRTVAVVAHEDKATANIFSMYDLYYNNLPEKLRPKIRRSNA